MSRGNVLRTVHRSQKLDDSYTPSDCPSAYSNVYSVLSSKRWRHLAKTPHPIVSVIS